MKGFPIWRGERHTTWVEGFLFSFRVSSWVSFRVLLYFFTCSSGEGFLVVVFGVAYVALVVIFCELLIWHVDFLVLWVYLASIYSILCLCAILPLLLLS